MFILGDSIVKNVNGYLLTKKLRNRELIKVRSLSEAKINCMYDHVKPSSREFYPYHLMLHVRTNELKSSKTTSQISKLFIDLALSLKLETKAVTISLVVPKPVPKTPWMISERLVAHPIHALCLGGK